METKLLQLKIPVSTGIVGKVIQTGEPVFFKNTESQAPMMTSMAKTDRVRGPVDAHGSR